MSWDNILFHLNKHTSFYCLIYRWIASSVTRCDVVVPHPHGGRGEGEGMWGTGGTAGDGEEGEGEKGW